VIEWESRAHSRGIRYVPVEVRAVESQPRPGKKPSKRARTKKDDTFRDESAPQPMEIDETLGMDLVEEPVVPTSGKRVCHPARPSLANLTYSPVSTRIH
jgi:hypothetical protein